MCERCDDTGLVVAVEHMGSYQMTYCDCEIGEDVARREVESIVMLEEDEIDREIFF